MRWLLILFFVVAILVSAFSTYRFLEVRSAHQALELRLTDAQARAGKLDSDLAAAHETTGMLKAQVGSLGAALTAAQAQTAAAEAEASAAKTRVGKLELNLSQAKQVVAIYEMTARSLADEVVALRKDLEDTRSSHAAPEAVEAYKTTIAELERQLATARNGAAVPAAGSSTAVFASRAGRATVLTIGPDNAFVVLNFGAVRGAQLGQKLTVNQGTHVVATVLISDVRANYSVAQVLPETLRGVLQKGDSAVLIR
jgi:hypothetical protein